ncbi:MAG: PhzF family phenazine biosynthesis protein [Candidatus Lokiarchaeota archaeon]|jgi:trans-2,3-dihydro-3-hydroxyanthranilate isomerase|nr:PhzF family phenazine biosynthesis protein [Candidatus Lokiarchaeota archaeon]
MPKCKFYIVDVFAERKYEGNQLAVFLAEDTFSDTEMQKIAREMNFSETTFITSIKDYSVRIFTPEVELPFAGHPTIGTAYVIQKEIVKSNIKTLLLNLKIGQIPVLFKYKSGEAEEIWMEQNVPAFGKFFDPELIANTLYLKEEDIDIRFPIQEVSTGLPFIIVPLKNLDALKRARVEREKFFDFVENTSAKSILVFCPEARNKGNHLSVRVFTEVPGFEDPATGSGNGCLAAYLVNRQYFGKNSVDIRVEQGYEIGRPSLLLLKAEEIEGKISVSVGGKAFIIAKGEFF